MALAKRKESSPGARSSQTFAFTDANFQCLRKLVADYAGISLSDHKRDLVYGRLTRRLRALRLDSFDDYCALLHETPDAEMENFINAITTNLTSFFRENHHFDYLKTTILPYLLYEKKQRRIRVWSAGCSTGEEPYSIAMTLRENIPGIDSLDVRILATDLDSNVVEHGMGGVYANARVDGMDKDRIKRWFSKGSGDNQGMVKVSNELSKMITFRQLNLMHQWPMHGPFDIIFCRNVVIYFDKETQKKLFERFADMIAEGGYLIIGHSETLHNVSNRFTHMGKTIYRKIK